MTTEIDTLAKLKEIATGRKPHEKEMLVLGRENMIDDGQPDEAQAIDQSAEDQAPEYQMVSIEDEVAALNADRVSQVNEDAIEIEMPDVARDDLDAIEDQVNDTQIVAPSPAEPTIVLETPLVVEAPVAVETPAVLEAPVAVDVPADEPKATLQQLISGELLPRLSLPLRNAGRYEDMNEALRSGMIRLGEVNDEPHFLLTAEGIEAIIEDEKHKVSIVLARVEATNLAIDKIRAEIAEKQEIIRQEEQAQADDMRIAEASAQKVSELQKILKVD